MPTLSDTTPEAERVWLEVLRRLPFARRWRQMGELYQLGRLLHAAGYRDRHPGASPAEIAADWRLQSLGPLPLPPGRLNAMADAEDTLAVVVEVIGVLDKLGIPYALGGSWASSLHGQRRYTHDADLTVEPFPGREAQFAASFGEDYYVSLEAIQDAVRRRASFNIIHLTSGFKVDLFVRKDRPFDEQVLRRRRPHRTSEPEGPIIQLVTPEDIILLKLEWFRLGGEMSERQWNDILGVLRVQASNLDNAYLDHWAQQLGVNDLLARVRQECAAGGSEAHQ
jgi:hypothetical protein